MRLIVTCAPGLEALLEAELRELGLEASADGKGIATLDGGWAEAARVLVRSRIAARVLRSVRRFSARTGPMLYDQVRRIRWEEHLDLESTFAIVPTGSAEGTDYALSWAGLRIKDAICDELRKRIGDRPDVRREDPDVRIAAHLGGGRCELSLDLTGAPLHRRSYRPDGAEAPLRENRAAALLRFAGYTGDEPVVDPFCGSGTLLIEAALIATRTAPGLLRAPDATRLWRRVPDARAALDTERSRASRERRKVPPEGAYPLWGSDVDKEALRAARTNARRAGMERWIRVRRGDARELEVRDRLVIANPPWGERLGSPEEAAADEAVFQRPARGLSGCFRKDRCPEFTRFSEPCPFFLWSSGALGPTVQAHFVVVAVPASPRHNAANR